jgi:hypothetical protein
MGNEFDIDDGLSLDGGAETHPDSEKFQEFDMVEWEAELRELSKRDADNKWKLGELLVKGEDSIPDFSNIPESGQSTFYARVALITGKAPNTLKDIASTYRRAASVRTDACSWSHHRVLVNALRTALPRGADEATKNDWLRGWLKKTVVDNISVARLKDMVRSKPKPTGKQILVNVAGDVWATLKDFADNERSTVQKVAAKWLEDNSTLEDTQASRAIAKLETEARRREGRVRSGKALYRSYPGKHFGED